MNKSIIALAIAGAMAAPMVAQADATLFGEIRYDIDKDENLDVNSSISRVRVGVKGEETMDNGLTAGYYIRLNGAVNGGAVTTSKTTMYVAGDFGKVIFGTQDSPSSAVEDRAEFGLYSGEYVQVGGDFTSGGIVYDSPSYNGLVVSLGMGNVDTADGTAHNAYSMAVKYDADNFGLAFGVGQNADTVAANSVFAFDTTTGGSTGSVPIGAANGDTHYAVSGTYTMGALKMGAKYSVQKVDNTTDDIKGYGIGGSYAVNDKLTLKLQHETQKTTSTSTGKMTAIEAAYSLGGNATLSLAGRNFNDDGATAGKTDAVKLRYHVSF
ncbi:MAG: porin [Pseudomonadales bacterium]|nr:porin [Pseudomonadales bacterium]